MEKIIKILKESPIVYFGTVKEDGTPDVRPFNFMLERDGKLYFCTSAAMGAYADLQNNSHVAISVMAPDHQWIRLYAKVVFTDDIEIKQTIFSGNETLKTLFETYENPNMKPFYLVDGTATFYDFSGNPPEAFNF